jgi:hypothetical protein
MCARARLERRLHHNSRPAMSAPPVELPPSHTTSGHHDGLGRRTLHFDREDGTILERLQVRPELGAFEAALRERMERGAAFEDERFARVRAIERDSTGALTVVSEFVAGNRVCDLLEAAAGLSAEEATSLSVDAALGFLLEMLPALAALHSVAGFSHGAVGPDRTVLTPTGQVVLLDSIFGHTLERLQLNRRRLWNELRVAAPAAAGPTRFDIAADLGQASLTGVMIVVGRLLKDGEYPDGLTGLVDEVVEIAQIRGSARFASGLHKFLQRTLPIPGRKPYASADEAATELRQLAREIGIDRCHTALVAFVADMNHHLGAVDLPPAASAWHGDFADAFEAIGEPVAAHDVEPAYEEEPIAADAVRDETGAAEEYEAPVVAAEYEEPMTHVEYDDTVVVEEVAAEAYDDPIISLDGLIAAEVEDAAPEIAYELEPVEDDIPVRQPDAEAVEERFVEAEAGDAAAMAFEPVPEELAAAAVWSSTAAEETARSLEGRDPVRELAVGREIDLVRERFAIEAERVAEPRIAYDDSFPDPTAEKPSAVPLLALQQETAAWRAAFVALDEQESVPSAPVAEPEPPAPSVRKRKRGSKGDRDKLRSNAVPRPVPVYVTTPVVSMPVPMALAPPAMQMPTPLYVPQAMPAYGRNAEATHGRSDPIRYDAPIKVLPVATIAPVASPGIGLRIKTAVPSGYTPAAKTADRRESDSSPAAHAYVARREPAAGSSFPWKLAAAAVVVIAGGVAAGRAYWPDRKPPAARVETVSTKAPVPAATAVRTGSTGSIEVATEPAGARVLLDGKHAGETPLTIDGVAPGRHTLTFVTATGSVKKAVRVESGKTLSVEQEVGSGWVAVFSPISLDISENGRTLGTDQGRLMLPPGRHELTFTNREFGYSAVQTVEVEPGQERSITVQPTGEISLNASPWAEVSIDGKLIGQTPIRTQVPLGTHEILFKNPEFGERRRTAVVTASAPLSLSVDFKGPSLP